LELTGFINLITFVMEKEIWKDVEGYEGRYQISNHGRVKSLKRKGRSRDTILKGAIKKLACGKRTYRYFHLSNGDESNVIYAHRLVGLHFVANPHGYKYINHKDCDMLNNYYKNLEWCTQKHNIRHAFKNGLMQYDLITEEEKQRRLENRKFTKVTYDEFVEIKEKYKTGDYTQYDLADEYNKDQSTISRLLKREKHWK
jgi:hypothetical protein